MRGMKTDLLYDLFANPATYGDLKFRLFRRIDDREKKTPDGTITGTLSRLKKQGLVIKRSECWSITKKGKQYVQDNTYGFKTFEPISTPKTKKQIVAVYDIPEKSRIKRDWLRDQMKNLGFEMFQRSVWIGPAPLPHDFVKYLNEIGVLKYVHFFEGRKKDFGF